MADYARIVVAKEALPSFQESLQIGRHVLERKLIAYKEKLKHFENMQGMDTPTFTRLFNQGELGDNKEWIEWDHAVSVVNVLTKKLQDSTCSTLSNNN